MRPRSVAYVIAAAIGCAILLFSPALFTGKILAVGDGRIEALPAFLAPLHLWNANYFLGYPLYADPNQAAFYPLRALALIPGTFNLYTVLSYAIAGAALFGYLVDVLCDRVAAFAGAVSFSCGGFMISHFGHPMIDHPAAWTIVALWTLARYHTTHRKAWLAGTAVALALSLSCGQPQIVLFAIVLLAAHTLVLEVPDAIASRSAGSLVAGLCAIGLGVSLGAVFLFPAVQLGSQSTRAALSFPAFTEDSIPLERLALHLIYPYASTGAYSQIVHGRNFAVQGSPFTETAYFIPVAALALALAGTFGKPRRLAWFWLFVACAGLALAAGAEVLPLAAWVYTLAPFNAFRIPGRHAYEITLAGSILAAFGIAALRTHARRLPLAAGIAVSILAIAEAAAAVAGYDRRLFSEPVILWFAISAAIQTIALGVAIRLRANAARSIATLAVIGGAVLFASAGYWRDAPSAGILAKPPYVERLSALPMRAGQRVYSYATDVTNPLHPNLPGIWGVPELAFYTPLYYPRIRRFLRITDDGKLLDPNSAAVDLAAIRYIAIPSQASNTLSDAAPFDTADLGLFLSGTSPDAADVLRLGVPHPVVVDRIAMVSALGASVDVPQGATIGRLAVHFLDGSVRTLPLRAGIDTAELAYNRADVRPLVRHAQPPIFSGNGTSTWFVASRPIDRRTRVRSIDVSVVPGINALNVRKLSLIDSVTHRSYAFDEESTFFAEPKHFRIASDRDGVAIFENLRAKSRVWVEGDQHASVTIDSLTPEHRDVNVSCGRACTLVSSDADNGDWSATVDGASVRLGSADGVLEAVHLSAGRHAVAFSYRPAALIAGAGVSFGSAVAIGAWMMLPFGRRHVLRA